VLTGLVVVSCTTPLLGGTSSSSGGCPFFAAVARLSGGLWDLFPENNKNNI